MKFVTSQRHYILTTYGYIQIRELAKLLNDNPKVLVKGFVFDTYQDSYKVSRIDYGRINIELLEESRKITGVRLFQQCILIDDPKDVYIFDQNQNMLVEFKRQPTTIITVLKHMVVDVQIQKTCSSNVDLAQIEVLDLPSITLSADESGSEAITLFNGSLATNGGNSS